MEEPSSNKFISKKQQSTTASSVCQICGHSAIYSFYGVKSCNPCRMFFKRNAQLGQDAFKCDSDDDCEININNRHFSSLNLLRSDQSTLTVDQWNLLSNLSHCYDEHSELSLGLCLMNEQNNLPLKSRFKNEALIKYFQVAMKGDKNNQDFLSLSIDNRSTLLISTMKHTADISTNFMHYMTGLLNIPAFYVTVALITHPTVVPTVKRIVERIRFDIVIIKLLLAIVCFSTINYTTYSNIPSMNLSNIKQILNIQDKYIDLLWRYLLYKYNYAQAIMYCSDLIRCLFAATEFLYRTDFVQFFNDKINFLVQQTDQSLNLND
ncbi:unnamed protein product [Rotaria sordida]|uniref:Nuclear receptor domain-containing protein n=1 Tax=Rotaria sordida TaxID=392033 RepID=A0A814XNY7_9BILA|nr:unnamed protein product [Rotaria sordida]